MPNGIEEALDINIGATMPLEQLAAKLVDLGITHRMTMSQANRDISDALLLRIATDIYNDVDEAKKAIQAAIKRALQPQPTP